VKFALGMVNVQLADVLTTFVFSLAKVRPPDKLPGVSAGEKQADPPKLPAGAGRYWQLVALVGYISVDQSKAPFTVWYCPTNHNVQPSTGSTLMWV
jgi:hypothetical protein